MTENVSLEYATTQIPETAEDVVFVGFFGCLICLGISANLYIVVCILARRRLRTVQNIYVVNISAADLVLSVNGIFSFLEMIGRVGSLSQGACRLLGVASIVPAFVVVLSTVVIARSRHQAVTELAASAGSSHHPLSFVLGSLACIWSVSVLVATPIGFGWVTMSSGLFCACCFYFSDNVEYGITITVAIYFVPNLLIAAYYVRILRHVRRSRCRVQQHQGPSVSLALVQLKRKNELRLAVQFIVIFLAFNLCYAPSMVVFWVQDDQHQVPAAADSFAMVLFSVNVLALPVIFVAFNRAAREEIGHLAQGVCRRPKKAKGRPPIATPKVITNGPTPGNSSSSEATATRDPSDETRVQSINVLRSTATGNETDRKPRTSVQSVSLSDTCQNRPANPLPSAM